MTSQEREREREIKHIATGTNPQPEGGLLLIVMVAAGMMKMATGDDFPLRRSAGTGSRLVSVATEPCGGGTSDLGLSSGVLEYLGIYRAKRRCGRPPRWAQPTWACLALGHALIGCAPLVAPLWYFFGTSGVFWSRKILQEVLLHLDSDWY